MPVQLGAGAVAARPQFNRGDIFQAHQLAHLPRTDNDVRKVLSLI